MKKLTPKSTIAEALKNRKAVTYAESHKPGITHHPALMFVKHMTLEKVCSMKQVNISRETLEEVLNKINNSD